MESRKYVTNVVEVDENIKILEFVEVMVKTKEYQIVTRCFECGNLIDPKNNPRDPTHKLWWCKERRIQSIKEFFQGKQPDSMLSKSLKACLGFTNKKPKKKNLDAFL